LTTETVLIAALSGRTLAASARRAGFAPLVVDAFADLDTCQGASGVRRLAQATRLGFRARPLLAALDALAQQARSAPIGLVLGSGFEDTPKLVATLTRRFPLLGNDALTIARTKDPGFFFPLLDRLGIAHPQTRIDPPPDPEHWLSKRVGGSGGAHVVACQLAKSSRRRYFQRRMHGLPVSVLAVARQDAVRIAGFSRQWTAGSGPRPYRYGGAVGPVGLGAAIEEHVRTTVEAVCGALRLVGLVSFDFLLADGVSYLLEVNPRPGATLDIFDDAAGGLFCAHVAACQDREFAIAQAQSIRAAGVLYADRGPLGIGALAWPLWTSDRPGPGTRISYSRPIATVFATGETATTAEYNCRRRLDELALMLYGRAGDTERKNAKIHRPRPERVGASGSAR